MLILLKLSVEKLESVTSPSIHPSSTIGQPLSFFFFVLDLSFSIGHRPLLFNEKLDKILASFRYVQPLK